MKVPCAFVVLAVVAVVASTSPAQNYQFAPKAAVPSSEALKSVSTPSPVPVQPFAYSGLDAARQYPPHSYQFSSEYTSPFSRSAFGPKSAAAPSQYGGAYQPYQQNGNFGPYQQYYPGSSGYSAASGSYPSAYSSQSGSYPTPYSAYPYAAQPYSSASYPSYPSVAYPSYPSAYQSAYQSAYPSYYNQFAAPSASPYSGQFASSTATPYSAQPSAAYQHQQLRSSFYNPAVDGQQFPSPQFQSQQYYPSVYQNSPAANVATAATAATAADSAKVSAEMK